MNSRMKDFLQLPEGSLDVGEALIHPEDRHKTLDLWGAATQLGNAWHSPTYGS